MTKLIIQIPCFNEEKTLGIALSELPREIAGVDRVEWLIVNDGSIDRTVEVARACGVDHIVSFDHNQGLARAFMAGIEASLKAGADIIVNTDADNQYCADDIPRLIEPILLGYAEVAIGARPIREIRHFSPTKKLLQKLGSRVVRLASRTDVADAPSGFRAFSREAAMRLNVFNEYTYTLETIIQAGQKGMAIVSVPVRTNSDLRPSRLVKSISSYIWRSILTIFRIFITYRPLRFFGFLGSVPMGLGILLCVRWLVLFVGDHIGDQVGGGMLLDGQTRARTPSLILAAILILIGFQLWIFGLIADLMAVNRKMLEDIQLRLRRIEYGDRKKP
ncbi:glycosyltransferase family 2 protein [Lyngbya sp. CCY1209]|uniref:glycosyltransferase family 2 protein n=1 Tax=Lyngbya sp. CCY1209 TaxID=2886103 RepID=UPI002D20BE8A|nr:glycosyltransferase family 2 protein [Lyngbya sp. CCY1209]MEB3882597.1 glycosyltransferase family 2 protein [Lyngbya sp. CCY1209]